MLKINLLPPHIHTKKQVRIAMFIVTVLVAAEVGVLVAARAAPAKLKTELEAKKVQVEGQKAELDKLKSAADVVQGEEASFQPKYAFVTDLMKYNKLLPSLYRNTARYTYREVTVLNLEASQNQLKFDAYVSDPADVSRLILGLSNNTTDFQQLPQVTGVPAYSAEEKRRETALANPLPETSIIGGYPGMPGAIGEEGGQPGLPGMMRGGYAGMSGMGGGGNGPGGPPGGMGAMGGMAGMPGMMGASGMSGMPGMGGAGGSGDIGLFQIDTATQKPRGFKVTVTCLLKNPIPLPDLEGARGSAGGGGGFSGMPGMGGGYGGMPGMGGAGMPGAMRGNGP
jgi:hypothetical protein